MTAVDHAQDLAEALRAVLIGCGLAKVDPARAVIETLSDEPSVLAAVRILQRWENR